MSNAHSPGFLPILSCSLSRSSDLKDASRSFCCILSFVRYKSQVLFELWGGILLLNEEGKLMKHKWWNPGQTRTRGLTRPKLSCAFGEPSAPSSYGTCPGVSWESSPVFSRLACTRWQLEKIHLCNSFLNSQDSRSRLAQVSETDEKRCGKVVACVQTFPLLSFSVLSNESRTRVHARRLVNLPKIIILWRN